MDVRDPRGDGKQSRHVSKNFSTALEGNEAPLKLNSITKSASLAQQAYDYIKAAIIAGEVLPNQLYSVGQFASILGVSRTPVREALLALSNEGLLEAVRNRGFRVLSVTQADIQEIVEVRRMLEIPAVERVARLDPFPESALEKIRSIYTELQASADSGMILDFLTYDRQFHLAIIASLGNTRLTSLIADLRDHMHLPGLRLIALGGSLHETGLEHMRLLEALEARNADLARQVMEQHLDRTLTDWSKPFES